MLRWYKAQISYTDKSIGPDLLIVFSLPLSQVYTIKHIAVQSAFTNICQRMSRSTEFTEFEYCDRMPLWKKVSLWKIFPPRYSTIIFKWHY